MPKYIECRNCDSPYCDGCNLYSLATMLNNGKFDCIMDNKRSINCSADVVEVVHGEWANIKDYGDYCLGHCSVCWTPQGATFPSALKEGFRYCRWCGAKMDGERRLKE